MDDDHKAFLIEHKDKLLEYINCDPIFIAKLQKEGVILPANLDFLIYTNSNLDKVSYLLNTVLPSQTNGWKALKIAVKGQSGAEDVLRKFKRSSDDEATTHHDMTDSSSSQQQPQQQQQCSSNGRRENKRTAQETNNGSSSSPSPLPQMKKVKTEPPPEFPSNNETSSVFENNTDSNNTFSNNVIPEINLSLNKSQIYDKEILNFVDSIRKLDIIRVIRPDKTTELNISDAYDIPIDSKGYALMLNIIEFEGMPDLEREGAERDVDYLTKVLRKLGYHVFPEDETLRNKKMKTKAEIIKIIEEFKERCKNAKPESIIVFLGSHGFYPYKLMTSDAQKNNTPVLLDIHLDIMNKFNDDECLVLKGKPKVFLVQACQSFPPNQPDCFNNPASTQAAIPQLTDAILCCAQSPGGTAMRNVYKGGWFVYCLTYVMVNHARDKHFVEMMDLVKDMLTKIKSGGGIEAQFPLVDNRLRKKLYFPVDT